MAEKPVVSDLVLAVLDASFEGLSAHFRRLLAPAHDNYEREYEISQLLERGSVSDLVDSDAEGFGHTAISRTYYRYLAPVLRGQREGRRAPRGVDRHIWGADYDRKMRSLFPTGSAAANPHEEKEDADTIFSGRTRVSAIFQQALLRNRRILQMEKASTALEGPDADGARAFSPSPYYIAKKILTDPDSPISEVYARAAIRTDILHRLGQRFDRIDLNYESISRGLDAISSRTATSKRAKSRGDAAKPEGVFLRNYLAALGVMAMEIEWDRKTPEARIDRILQSPENLFDVGPRGIATNVSFRLHPDYSELPDAGELLNEIQGLPLPVEGASTIFHGGLRFASGGDVVGAISGPFGAGKTSACLSIAASLAPLGCRTLYLSCEEGPDDIASRLSEATPEYVTRSTPLFRAVDLDSIRRAGQEKPWFSAHMLRVSRGGGEPSEGHPIDVANDLIRVLDEALETAPIFEPFRRGLGVSKLPAFARPVVIVDGFHQLFRESSAKGATIEHSLRVLIDRCKERSAIFLFTVAEDEPAMQRLDYLCDLVIQLDHSGLGRPDERATRLFRLLKARRQPAIIGAHIMHLAGPKSFRVKPSVSGHAEKSKNLRWMDPDASKQIRLSESWDALRIQNRSQTLVYGKGSSGKAGLGLYILHRRPLPYANARDTPSSADLFDDFELDIDQPSEEKFITNTYEARTLVVSFLYQAPYYRHIARRLRVRPRRSRTANQSLPDRARIDVISLYPGGLTPEDFLAKIDNQLNAAELRGLPYTGVLVDGIHNVFVQYPALQDDTTFWPQLYNTLRRRGVSVITTHTEFELREAGAESKSMSVDFEHAQRKAAPLLSVLVSAADYAFELSAHNTSGNAWEYRLAARSTLGEDPPIGYVLWNRQLCRLGDAFLGPREAE